MSAKGTLKVFLTIVLPATVFAGGTTKVYHFIPSQSAVVQTGGIGAQQWFWQVEGRFARCWSLVM